MFFTLLGVLSAGVVTTGALARPQPGDRVAQAAVRLPENHRAVDLHWNEKGLFHWVEVKFNGKPAVLQVDTGAGASFFLDQETAKAAGIEAIGKTNVIAFNGAAREATLGLADEVALGPVTMRRVPVYVVDNSEMAAGIEKRTGVRLRGLIGASVLKGGGAILDYRQHKMYLDNTPEIELRRMQGRWATNEVVFA
ncbi:MAG TPA: retropepsin-like aspartic protease, partial [Urbifossiella sp.]|nr:retropepsin-like aspartic protease [Urbifossiella sp.]